VGVKLRKTPAFLAVVEVLLHSERPYGLEIIERTGLPSGTVYPLLARLENAGWITSRWEDGDDNARGPRKRIYEVTPAGAEQAREALAGQKGEAADRTAHRAKRRRLAEEPGR
jgi:PadR family transcriptional regulator PadR